jgi:hypothetical protein
MSNKIPKEKLDIAQWQSILYTIYSLLKDSQKTSVHVEDIALNNKKKFPSFFGWSKYPENIDLRQIMRTLDKLKRDGYLLGSNTTTWSFSKDGFIYAEKLASYDLTFASKLLRGNTDYHKKELNRLVSTEAFKKHNSSDIDKILDTDLKYLFRIDSYNKNPEMVNKNYQKMLIAAKNNHELLQFIETMFIMIKKREII